MNTSPHPDILLVEDNNDDLELSLLALRKMNLAHGIQVARDGVEALDFIFCRGAHAGRRIESAPRLVLLDLKLPKVDGLEVLRSIKATSFLWTKSAHIKMQSKPPRGQKSE